MGTWLTGLRWLFDSRDGPRSVFIARWLFSRALALIYLSAFYSLLFQIRGLIGLDGILPAREFLVAATRYYGSSRFWQVPTLLWISAGNSMLMALVWAGIIASILAFFNLWPRLNLFLCFVCFLSFVAAASDFSGYQSDGMLLEAGFLALFFVPPGLRPGWGLQHPPSRASLFLLRWEWFRIYFESGLVKILSGDSQWRNLTAMDQYYQNSPLPTWIGWYVGHLPHGFQATTVVLTLVMEFGVVLLLFFPRRLRLICFCIVTAWEIGVILTGNYAFLNYIVLALGLLLIDDVFIYRLVPARFRPQPIASDVSSEEHKGSTWAQTAGMAWTTIMLAWIGYATTAELVLMLLPGTLPKAPIAALDPFRIANQYGLFAVMTRGRYEIEFQGSNDGENWQPYLFRYKPQLPQEAPGIYAPYQPRFDWNLWFASLGDWQQNQIVPLTEEKLLANDTDVLALFRGNPFTAKPPLYVRAILWQYWFTSLQEKRQTGDWWRRKLLGLYAPVLTRTPDGKISAVQLPDALPPHD